jgi:hypothetical protein
MITRGGRTVARSSLRKNRMAATDPIPLRLHEDIEDNPVLINGSPEVVSDAVDLEKNLVQTPFVPGPGTPSPETVGILLPNLPHQPDRFVADQHSACGHHLFHIANTQSSIASDGSRST